MGGQGSGRPPNVETILRRPEMVTPVGDDLIIPNYSGLQDVKKTDPAISGGSGDTRKALLSGEVDYVFLSTRHTYKLEKAGANCFAEFTDSIPKTRLRFELWTLFFLICSSN